MTMITYHVEFEFKHIDAEEPQMASTTIEAEREPKTNEEFNEISKTLFRSIEGCSELRLLRVYEDSELVRAVSKSMKDYGEFIID